MNNVHVSAILMYFDLELYINLGISSQLGPLSKLAWTYLEYNNVIINSCEPAPFSHDMYNKNQQSLKPVLNLSYMITCIL